MTTSDVGLQASPMPQGALLGRYEVVREIGRGAMAVVYEGLDLALGRPVAVKFLNAELRDRPDVVERFHREALAAGRIGHESICDVRDLGVAGDGSPFIVMELLRGESLAEHLARVGRLDPRRAIELMAQVLAGLAAAHAEGIVHRDLKPGNVFLAKGRDGAERLKIVDFGISMFVAGGEAARLTTAGTVVGTPAYMSPEQARGSRSLDLGTDIWAAGVMLYEMVTGELPFDGESYNEILFEIAESKPLAPSALRPDLPLALEACILKALEPDRAARFRDASSFAAALLGVLPLLPAAGPGTSPGLRPSIPPTCEVPPAIARRTPSTVVAWTTPGDGASRGPRAGRAFVGAAASLAVLLLAGGAVLGARLASGRLARPASASVAVAAPLAAPAPSLPPAEVSMALVGLPDGAAVAFAGGAVADGRLVGPPGTRGLLAVSAPGFQPLAQEVVLAAGGLDVGALMRPLEPERAERARPGRRRARPREGSPAASAGQARPLPAAEDQGGGFVTGRRETRVIADYGSF